MHPLATLLVDQVLFYPINNLRTLCYTDIKLGTPWGVDDFYQF